MILETSDSEVGLKTEKSGWATGGEDECGEAGEELLDSDRRTLDILSVKKWAKRSAIEVAADDEGKCETDLQLFSRWPKLAMVRYCPQSYKLSDHP